jgi:cytochrome P450
VTIVREAYQNLTFGFQLERPSFMPAGQSPLQHSPRERRADGAVGLWWSDGQACWMATDPDIILAIFKDKAFEVTDYEGETFKIIDELGVDLSAMARVARHLPLAKEGCAHSALRKQMAITLAKNSPGALLAVERSIQSRVACAFARFTHFDLVEVVLAPLVNELVSALGGVRVAERLGKTSPSQMFDKTLGLNRRKAINQQIGDLYGASNPNGGHLGASSEADVEVALAVLGFDALLGTLGESFLHEIRSNPGNLLSEIEWSESVPVTGVPYVDRIANRSVAIGGVHIEGGERVRLYLNAPIDSGSNHQDFFFGAGRHACLGRSVSQTAWRLLTANLGTVQMRAIITKVDYRQPDNVFNCPISIKVSLDDGQQH